MRRMPQLCTAIALAATTALAATPAHSQSAKPNVVVILDSSRSMWGQIDGINKVVSARTVLGQIAKDYADKTRLGLVAYGHRQSAGCTDIEVVLPLASYTPKRIAKVVKGIKPKGSTPIADSMVRAAKAADYTKKKATLVLLADGLDNCKGDPCATATKLRKSGKNLKIHVVAFDRKTKTKLESLSCVAENAGGTFASATSEAQLKKAMEAVMAAATKPAMIKPAEIATDQPSLRQSQELAAVEGNPADQAVDLTTTGAIPSLGLPVPSPLRSQLVEPAVDKKTEPAAAAPSVEQDNAATLNDAPVPISLRALLTDAGPEIKAGLVWRIFRDKPNAQGRYDLVSTHREASPTAALSPGAYLINAAYGLSHITKKMTVLSSVPISETLVLNAGGLRLASVLANGEPITPNSVRYDVFEDETDQFGNRDKILGDAKPGLIIRLNAGVYHIISVYGDANAVVRADVTVEPGKLTEATINHSAARATFKLVVQPGGEALPDTQWNILTPGGDVVKESAGALPSHILAAGSYTVLARHKGKNYSREFKLDIGEDRQIEVVIR